MVTVAVYKQSLYPVSDKLIREKVVDTLSRNGLISDSEVSVALVGKTEISKLTKAYLDSNIHSVLTFTTEDIKGNFVFPPRKKNYLGEIVICYPKAQEEARRDNKLIEEKVSELLEHATFHLLGKHHE